MRISRGHKMNELTVVEKAADERRMKALVLDSVSSPITKRGDGATTWRWKSSFPGTGRGAAARLHQGDRQRLARIIRILAACKTAWQARR
jgi:hypothetical protein